VVVGGSVHISIKTLDHGHWSTGVENKLKISPKLFGSLSYFSYISHVI